uniref:Uncharacterized protein n=1 Tax=Myotis myotis TaxID=51298 RepID=A0A7J8ALP3_MYOMY|nr:hypothetical protein mMyoMyo1_007993 [Myotis myotis]
MQVAMGPWASCSFLSNFQIAKGWDFHMQKPLCKAWAGWGPRGSTGQSEQLWLLSVLPSEAPLLSVPAIAASTSERKLPLCSNGCQTVPFLLYECGSPETHLELELSARDSLLIEKDNHVLSHQPSPHAPLCLCILLPHRTSSESRYAFLFPSSCRISTQPAFLWF